MIRRPGAWRVKRASRNIHEVMKHVQVGNTNHKMIHIFGRWVRYEWYLWKKLLKKKFFFTSFHVRLSVCKGGTGRGVETMANNIHTL